MNKTFIKLAAVLTIAVIIFSSCEDKKSEGSLQLGSTLPALKCLSSEPVITSAVVTITDDKGSKVYENYKVEIMNMNGYYISKPLSLKEGSYKLCSFALVDNSNAMLYATPVAGSSKAYLVQRPLSCDFTISKDEVTKLDPEVISTTSCVPQDFGYATFTYSIVRSFDFYLGVLVYNDTIKNFKMTNAVFTAAAPGKSIVTLNIPNATQRISMPSGLASYSISVSKQGYKTYTKSFTEEQLAAYNGSTDSAVLKVILNKTMLMDGLIAWYPFNGTFKDETGNGNDGTSFYTLFGADRNGIVGTACLFDAYKSSYVSLKNPFDLPQKTISIWFFCKSFVPTTSDFNIIYSSDNPALLYADTYINIQKTNEKYMVRYGHDAATWDLTNIYTYDIDITKWHHAVITADDSNIKYYLDGNLLITLSNHHHNYRSDQGFNYAVLGTSRLANNQFFNGTIDDVRIFNRALTADEVTLLNSTKD